MTWSTKPWTKLELVLTAVWISETSFTQSPQTSSLAYKKSSILLGESHISQAAIAPDMTGSAAPGSQAWNLLPFTEWAGSGAWPEGRACVLSSTVMLLLCSPSLHPPSANLGLGLAARVILRVQQERDAGHEGGDHTGHVHLRDLVGLKLFLGLLGQVLLKGLAEVECRAHFLRVTLERKRDS